MQIMFKEYSIPGVGGIIPNNPEIKITGQIGPWRVADVPDYEISTIQEFTYYNLTDELVAKTRGPTSMGPPAEPIKPSDLGPEPLDTTGYNLARAIDSNGDTKYRGNMDAESFDRIVKMDSDNKQSNTAPAFSEADVQSFQDSVNFIRNVETKLVLRDKIRGSYSDLEDDIADTKVASQFALYYLVHEWNAKSDAKKSLNPARTQMDALAQKMLSEQVIIRADLKAGSDAMSEIIAKEDSINDFVSKNYRSLQKVTAIQ